MVRVMDKLTFPISIKSVAESGVIEGIVSAFDQVDSYGDTIVRGAYAKSIAQLQREGRSLPLLYQHDHTRPIGVWTDLEETPTGLKGRAELALEVRDAREAHALARKGALTGISIGYQVAPGGARKEGNRRLLSDIVLHEASLVTFPADRHARVTAVKSIGCAHDIALLLQEAGISNRKAKQAAGAAWKALNSTENDDAAIAVLSQALKRLNNF